jgi:hypothetical protein
MSPTAATTPLIEILTKALRKAGASQAEIDETPLVDLREGVSTPDDQRSLGLARLLVQKVNAASESASAAASDPIVGCFFTEGGRHCALNVPLSTWDNIKATIDPGATKGSPVSGQNEGCFT